MPTLGSTHHERDHVLSAAYGGELWSPRLSAMTEDMASTWGDWGVSSEIGRLHAVLLRRPGPELDAVTDFDAMQMRSDLSPDSVREQHDALADDHGALNTNYGRKKIVGPNPKISATR